MKKRFLSVFLALALCLGLCPVPALAATEAELASISVTCTAGDRTLKEDEFVWVDQPWKRVSYEEGLGYAPGLVWGRFDDGFNYGHYATDCNGYYVIRNNSVITVTNTDPVGRDSYVYLSVFSQIKHDDGMYWNDWIDRVWPSYVVLESGKLDRWWLEGPNDDGEYQVVLRPGQSIQFSFPTSENDEVYNEKTGGYDDLIETTDVIYELEVSKADWDNMRTVTEPWGDTNTYPTSYEKTFLFKIDNAAVDSALADLTDPATTAYANTQTVLLDGNRVEFQAYALKDTNGNLTNYVKVRDVAYYLNGTPAQFSVDWNLVQGISLNSGSPYTPINGDLSTPFSGNQPYERFSAQTIVNRKSLDLDTISLDNGGYTYYKLRDLGRALDFNVSYINGQIVINTSEPYSDAQ